jgi:hypothetical protein
MISDGSMRVLGAGAVTLIDAHDLRYTDSSAVHRGQPLAMLGVKLDVLTSGCHYDLERRLAYPPPEGTVRLDAAEQAAAEASRVDLEPLEAGEREGAGGPTLAERTADRGD